MPFQSQQPPRPPQGPRGQDPNEYPLQRLCGLFPSRAGNALMGNLRDQDLDLLETVIDDARRSGRPLRILVFENRKASGNQPPYNFNVTLGTPRAEQAGGWRTSGAQAPYNPPDPDGGESDDAGEPAEEAVPEWVQAPQPPAAPAARPRRGPQR